MKDSADKVHAQDYYTSAPWFRRFSPSVRRQTYLDMVGFCQIDLSTTANEAEWGEAGVSF